jgi:hypothetical protein
MSCLHVPGLLHTAQAVPFTYNEACAAERSIMGRYTRTHLRATLLARKAIRRALRAAIEGGHYLQAVEQAHLHHILGVQSVMLIRRHARTAK